MYVNTKFPLHTIGIRRDASASRPSRHAEFLVGVFSAAGCRALIQTPAGERAVSFLQVICAAGGA